MSSSDFNKYETYLFKHANQILEMNQLKTISYIPFFVEYHLSVFCTIGNKYSSNSFNFNERFISGG